MTERPRYRIDLQAEASTVPAHVRLKRALKCLLRSFGFKAQRVEHLQPEAPVLPAVGEATPAAGDNQERDLP